VGLLDSGGSLDDDNLRHRVFHKLLDKAELRRVSFHDLRHTFANLLLQNGVRRAKADGGATTEDA